MGKNTQTFANLIDALKSEQSTKWEVADAILSDVKVAGERIAKADYDCTAGDRENHDDSGKCCAWNAQRHAGLVPRPYNTARADWAIARYWPTDKRFDGVTYSAHRAAMAAGEDTQAGVNAIQAVLNTANGDTSKVTVSAVDAVVGDSTKSRAGNARKGGKGGYTVAQVTAILDQIKVGTHLGGLDDKALDAWIATLESALDKAVKHRETRQSRAAQSQNAGKVANPTGKSGKGGPKTARG